MRTHNPNVFVGVCLQYKKDEDEQKLQFFRDTSFKFHHQLRIRWIDHQNASGPCFARAETQKLYAEEEFYLQIDSHMRFREGWDDFLVEELKICEELVPKPVLTTYPAGYFLPNELSKDTRATLLCAKGFDDSGLLRQVSRVLKSKLSRPVPSLFWAAGFSFSRATMVQEVPYDPTLKFLFFGEEQLMNTRLWTSGWDFFAPTEQVVYHLWSRNHRPVFSESMGESETKMRNAAIRFVKSLVTDEGQKEQDATSKMGIYQLGSSRTLSQYEEWSGLNFRAQEIQWRSEWGNMDPINFDLAVANSQTI